MLTKPQLTWSSTTDSPALSRNQRGLPRNVLQSCDSLPWQGDIHPPSAEGALCWPGKVWMSLWLCKDHQDSHHAHSYRSANYIIGFWQSACTRPLELAVTAICHLQAMELQSSDQSSAQDSAESSSRNPTKPQLPRMVTQCYHCSYFSQQEDSLHVLLF